MVNCVPEGDMVIEDGEDFDFLNAKRSVELLYSHTLSGFS